MSATETPAAAPTTGTNADLIRWSFGVLNTHHVTPLKAFWTDETWERFPTGTARGADDIASVFDAAFAAMPDFRIEIVDLAEQGDNVFVRWHMTGTHSGEPWEGYAPSGKRIELDGIDHFVVRDGRVVSNFVVFDQVQFARQVGVMPEVGTPGDKAMKAAFALRTRIAGRLRR
jgi:steroid delta-isomerase-like uncharacterized protein